MPNKITLKKSSVVGRQPQLEDLDWGELALNFADGKLYYKTAENEIRYFYDRISQMQGDEIENVIFVAKNGDDANSGLTWATSVATFERALEIATLRNGAITLIDVAPGIYETEGHLDVPDNCIIKGVHRSVIIRPKTGFEQRNVFRLGSGCFIEGFLFENFLLDSYTDPSEGFAVSFRPGAIIRRAPYAHKIAIRTPPTWDMVPPPLDKSATPLPNPLVGRGGGVILCDGMMCSPYSLYPNIMTWGATPVTHNGIGYVAKNGGLINAVNAVSMWAHIHFLALSGGQIILSGCSTQFGDYTMVAKGTRSIVYPTQVTTALTVQTADATLIDSAKTTIINDMWTYLVNQGYTTTWTSEDETYTRRDAAMLLQSISWVLQSANEQPMLDFARGMFNTDGTRVFSSDKLAAFVASWEFMRDEINSLTGITSAAQTIVTALFTALTDTVTNLPLRNEPSTITAIGHTWTAIMAGVALTRIPPARNETTIMESIQEIDGGVVIASGQDDQGSALFIGGLEINADTGELTGPPFDQSVSRIATRAAIARSF